jgi:peptidoglycan/xylan/chitin deacetylase (PgdA/CDA1 family)
MHAQRTYCSEERRAGPAVRVLEVARAFACVFALSAVLAWGSGAALAARPVTGPPVVAPPSAAQGPARAPQDPAEAATAKAISLANPERTVSAFYRAVSRKDCAQAEALWPGYGEARCLGATDVNLMSNRVVCSDPRTAVVLKELTYIRTEGRARGVEIFQGYVSLDLKETGWVIRDSSQRPQEAMSLEAYTRDVARMSTPCGGLSPNPASSQSASPQAATLPTAVGPMPVRAPAPTPSFVAPAASPPKAGAAAAPAKLPPTAPPPAPPLSVNTYYVPPQDFGSHVVLEACWPPEERQGADEDKLIKSQPDAGRAQPPRDALNYQLRPLPPELQNSIRRVETRGFQKIVALTFDLCERQNEITGYDAGIVNYLRANGVKATFFAGGKWMATHPDKAMQLMADPLFEIGNHGWTHANLRQLKGREMEEQILGTQAQYEQLWDRLQALYAAQKLDLAEMEKIPKAIQVFRFPYGVCSAESLRFLANHGLPAIQWDVVTGDPAKEQTAEGIVRAVMSETKPGSIIICHANGRGAATASAVAQFVPKLREKGFHFVTASELISLGKPQASPECYERKPGDNARYDK